jgi:hypothetical protein
MTATATEPRTERLSPEKHEIARKALARITMERHPEMPPDLNERWKLAQTFYESRLCPKNYENVQQIFLALQLGAELGLAPFYAMSNIAVVNGRAGLMYNAKLAVARSTGQLEEYSEELAETEARIWIKRKDRPGFWSAFTMDEATRAGLTADRGGHTSLYKKYPKRMLRARAGSWALDREFGDVLAGLMSTEELEAEPFDEKAPANEKIAAAPAATAAPGWQMTEERSRELKRIIGAKKIPVEDALRIEHEATGGRALETAPPGYRLYREAEFGALKAMLQGWKPTAAPAAETQTPAAPVPVPVAEAAPDPQQEQLASGAQITRVVELAIAVHGKGVDVAALAAHVLEDPGIQEVNQLLASEADRVIAALERQQQAKPK